MLEPRWHQSHIQGRRETRRVNQASRRGGCCKQGLLCDELTSRSIGRVLGHSPAALSPGEVRPPLPTKTTDGDSRCSGLAEAVAANRPMERDRQSMDVGTRAMGEATGRQGYRLREQVTVDEERAEGP